MGRFRLWPLLVNAAMNDGPLWFVLNAQDDQDPESGSEFCCSSPLLMVWSSAIVFSSEAAVITMTELLFDFQPINCEIRTDL